MNPRALSLTTAAWIITLAGYAPAAPAASAAYKLAFTTQPATTVVGAVLTNVVVQIEAKNGTNVPQSGTVISLSLNRGPWLTGTTSATTDAGGKATFANLAVIQANTGNTLQASASGLQSATSSTFTISKGKTAVALASSANPAAYGQTITFTATITPVAPATGKSSGPVTFKNGTVILGTASIDNLGHATFIATNRLLVGSHSITAAYAGDTNFTASSATLSQSITKAALTVSGILASNKVYDAKTTAALKLSGAALAGVYAGDNVILNTSAAKGTFADKNVGNAKTVAVSGLTISGTNSGNYSLTQPVLTANITPRNLTVSAKGANKVYDGTTNATVTLSDNRISGDVLSASYAGASFTNKNVGSAKPVTVRGIAISGTDAGNYKLTATTAATSASITAATLTVSGITAADRVYNGKTTATLVTNSAALAGVVPGDTVTLNLAGAKGNFSDKNVGTAKTVTITGLKISGADATNYKLVQPSTTASITARTLKVTAQAADKTYDGTTAATVTFSDNRIAGDVLTVSAASAAFTDKNAGAGKTVNVTGLAISGTDACNYALASTTVTAAANITKALLTVTADSLSRPYGAANPTLAASISGFVNNETLAASGVDGSPDLATTATDASTVAGSPYPITVAIGSLAAANYAFNFADGSLTVTPADTAVAVNSGLNPAATNQEITFTVTVTAAAPSTATAAGTIQFTSNGAPLGSPVTLTNGQGNLTITGAALGIGSFAIAAAYADPNGNFNSSSNSLTQTVTAPAPAMPCQLGIGSAPGTGCIQARLTGTPYQAYVLEASTDMVHWTAIATNTADANGSLSFADPDSAKYPMRFYRSATLR